MKTAKNEIISILTNIRYRDRISMFRDFVESFAIRLSFVSDKDMIGVRTKRFNAIMKQYSSNEHAVFSRLGQLLIEALKQESENGPQDVLSEIFHTAGLDDKSAGESFTPPDISLLMANLAIEPVKEAMIERIKTKGYVSLYDCCSGAGSLFLTFAKVMYENGLNYCTQLLVEGWDIDLISVCMTYIQLTLNGIPAILRHKNTITLEEYSVWHTYTYVSGAWDQRRFSSEN